MTLAVLPSILLFLSVVFIAIFFTALPEEEQVKRCRVFVCAMPEASFITAKLVFKMLSKLASPASTNGLNSEMIADKFQSVLMPTAKPGEAAEKFAKKLFALMIDQHATVFTVLLSSFSSSSSMSFSFRFDVFQKKTSEDRQRVPVPLQRANEYVVRHKAGYCLHWLNILRATIRELGRDLLADYDATTRYALIVLLGVRQCFVHLQGPFSLKF